MRNIQVQFYPLTIVAGASIPALAAGTPVKAVTFTKPIRMIRFINATNQLIYIGTSPTFATAGTANIVVQANTDPINVEDFDFTTNQTFNQGFFLQAGTTLYISSTAGAPAGNFYINAVTDKGAS